MAVEGDTGQVRRRVVYTGRVQGVCFRMSAAELSHGYRVAGWVRNLRDGTVELEAEGAPDQVEGLLQAVARYFKNNIAHVQVDELPARGDQVTFEIRF